MFAGKDKEGENMTLKIVLDKGAFALERAHRTDAGFDIRTPYCFTLKAHSFLRLIRVFTLNAPKDI